MGKYSKYSTAIYEDKVAVTCTDNSKVVTVDVHEFTPEKVLTVYLATNKIVMYYNQKHKNYAGSMFNMEFTSPGPKTLGSYR